MSWHTRVYLTILGITGLITGAVLIGAPDRTADYFVWPVGPPTGQLSTVYFIGAGYLGTGLTTLGALFIARSWQEVRLLIGPIVVFAGLMLAATGLHAEKFFWDRPQTWLWVSLYGVIMAGAAILARTEPPARRDVFSGRRLTRAEHLMLAFAGLVMAVWAAAMFVFPSYGALVWPWPLTLLTDRVIAGWISVGAALSLSGALTADAATLRVPLMGWMVTVTLFILAALASSTIMSPQDPRTWLYFAGLGASLAGAGLLLRRLATAPPLTASGVADLGAAGNTSLVCPSFSGGVPHDDGSAAAELPLEGGMGQEDCGWAPVGAGRA
ncbi:MAG: hypothetical protein EXR58_04165 [Chloroflexi bacterium]|nr:hypothetical protein [Chloroflexota bacterium]